MPKPVKHSKPTNQRKPLVSAAALLDQVKADHPREQNEHPGVWIQRIRSLWVEQLHKQGLVQAVRKDLRNG